jgi:hypothetical protein
MGQGKSVVAGCTLIVGFMANNSPEDPKKDQAFKKVVERMLKTPPKPHAPPKKKAKRKKPKAD